MCNISFFYVYSDLELHVPVDLPVDLRGAVVEDVVRAVSNAKWTRTSYDPVAQFVRTRRFTSRPSLRRDRIAARPLPQGTSSVNANAPYSNVVINARSQTGEYMTIEPGSASESHGSDDDDFGPETPPAELRLELSADAAPDDVDTRFYENQLIVRPPTSSAAADSRQQQTASGGAAQSVEAEVRYAPAPSPPRQLAVDRTPPEASGARVIQVQVHSESVESSVSPHPEEGGVPAARSRSKKQMPKRPKPSQNVHHANNRVAQPDAADGALALADRTISSSRTSLQEQGADYEIPTS